MQAPEQSRFLKVAPYLFFAAIAIAIVSIIVATQLNASRRAAKIAAPGAHIVVPFTGFGGYNWTGNVTTISTEFVVPTIADDSSFGAAATWIGVQNDVNNQFVQVGVEENDFGDGPNQYQAFWSDLTVGFAPQTFGEVYPGDKISLSMSRSSRGWELNFVDLSRKLRGKKFVAMSRRVPFTQGEWIQEDPSPSTNTAQDVAYPKMSEVSFEDLKVNGAIPALDLGDAQVLIASSGAIGVPSPIVDDAFTLSPPAGPALRYLGDEQSLDAALNQFDVQLSSWSKASPSKESSVAATLSSAFASNARSLASQRWPASSRGPVDQLLQSDRRQLSDIKSWERDDFNTQGLAFTQFQQDLNQSIRLVNELRATLELPPL
ncbi:MAG: hypothetical protein WCF25_08805 [Acidimicrobiales bacterium]